MSAFFDHAIDFLSQEFFVDGFDSSEIYGGIEFDIPEECQGERRNWVNGASKVCVLLEDCVLKTSIDGWIEDFDEETYDSLPEPEKNYFLNDMDDCAVEFFIYQKAIEEGVSRFFCKTEKTRISTIFKQEKCDTVLSDFHDTQLTKKKNNSSLKVKEDIALYYCKKDLRTIYNALGLFDLKDRVLGNIARGYLLAYYSVNDLKCLQRFLSKYDINDLHAKNIGMMNGKPVIFDFCGYGSSTCSKVMEETKNYC